MTATTPRKSFPTESIWLPRIARNKKQTGEYHIKVTRTSFSSGVMTVFYVYNFLTGPAAGTTSEKEYSLTGGEFLERFFKYNTGGI